MYGYNERKAAQVAAFFALKQGGRINVLKIAKLLYLAERRFMERFDEPMFYDKLVSMDHGPVTSISLNLINGLLEGEDWSKFITDRDGYDVGVVTGVELDDLDHLSKADVSILAELWDEFGVMNQYQLRDWTHRHCLEWENPHGSSEPIRHDRVFKFLQKKNADELAENVHAYRSVSNSMDAG